MATDSATKTIHILTAEEILKAPDTKTAVVDVPEWGGSVKVIGLTKQQQVDIREGALRNGEIDPAMTQRGMLLQGVIEPRFTEEQIGPLFDKNAGLVDRLLVRILELSGMGEGAVAAKEAAFPPGA